MMNEDDVELIDVTAQEIALHTAMCVNMQYIQSWGLLEFLSKLCEYLEDDDLQQLVNTLNTMYSKKEDM